MDNFSSGESSKPYSPQKAAFIEDLKNSRQSNAQYLEMMRQMEARLQSLDFKWRNLPVEECSVLGISSVEKVPT